MAPRNKTWHAFTNNYDGVANRLITKAKVAEAFDPNKTDPNLIKHIETDALWDTGATQSVITPAVVQDLGLTPTGKAKVRHGGGESEEDTYVVNLVLPNGVGIPGVPVLEMKNTVDNFGIIIGMDLIALGDFSVTNYRGKTCFSYRFPSQHSVDFVREANAIMRKSVNPNTPCHCGSGRKFKKCHGARA